MTIRLRSGVSRIHSPYGAALTATLKLAQAGRSEGQLDGRCSLPSALATTYLDLELVLQVAKAA